MSSPTLNYGFQPVTGADNSFPLRVTPGDARFWENSGTTRVEHLSEIAKRAPEILEAQMRYYAEQDGLFTSLFWALQGGVDPEAARKRAKANGMVDSRQWVNKIKKINDYQMVCDINSPDWHIQAILADVPATNGYVGANQARFTFTVDRGPIKAEEVYVLDDDRTYIFIVHAERLSGTTDAHQVTAYRLGSNAGIPADLLRKNSWIYRSHNIKAEMSTFGSESAVYFKERMTNFVTTMRLQWSISGHAMRTSLKQNELNGVKFYVFTDSIGNKHGYWMSINDDAMLRSRVHFMNQVAMYGLPNIDPTTGAFKTDQKGNKYYSGYGAYWQMSPRLRFPYSGMQNFNLFDNMFNNMTVGCGKEGDQDFVLFCGQQFITNAQRLFGSQFNNNPIALFFNGTGNYNVATTAQAQEEKGIGISLNNMVTYRIGGHSVTLVKTPAFDRISRSNARVANGTAYNSHRAIIVNITSAKKGMSPLHVVSVLGTAQGAKLATIADPVNGYMASPVDMAAKHEIFDVAAFMEDPFCIGEFTPAMARI